MNFLLCVAAISMMHNVPEDRWDTCVELVDEAERQGVPPNVVVAVAMVESRLNAKAVSPAGAVGPIQVLPKWHCQGRTAVGCNLIETGVSLLKRLRVKYDSWELAWCHYSAGTRCTERGKLYAGKVRRWLVALWVSCPWVIQDGGMLPPAEL